MKTLTLEQIREIIYRYSGLGVFYKEDDDGNCVYGECLNPSEDCRECLMKEFEKESEG